jgi:hypothetical protein
MILTPWYKALVRRVDPRPVMNVVDFYVARRPSPRDGAETVNFAEGRMASQSPFGDKNEIQN